VKNASLGENLILISRIKSNRKVCEYYEEEAKKKYGKKMKLNNRASATVARAIAL